MSADRDFSGGLFINGHWLEGSAGNLDNIDPGTGAIIGTVTLADPSQVDAAITAASAAFASWKTTLPAARGLVLTKTADSLADRFDEAVTTILTETGKTLADARSEITRSIDNLRWNGEQAARITGREFAGVSVGSRRRSVPTPLGVVVAITAWNFPAVLATRKVGAALAAGCTVILKGSEFTPATTRLLAECFEAAGLPAGVLNLVHGDPAAVSKQLLASRQVKALTFTGSTAVGKILAAQAAPNLIRTVLELGGHAPVIVWDDADIDHVIATTAPAKFGSAGQSCVAPTRYIVHNSLYERLTDALSAKADSYVLGHGTDPGVTLGAVASQVRVDALTRLTRDALDRGATLRAGGTQLERDGFYFRPTVLSDVPADADIMAEEPFGPIATLTSVATLDEAIDLANSSPYSFAAYLFTDRASIRSAVIERLEASNLGINQTAPSLPDVPLGGLGNSGSGYEGGLEGVLAFMHLRLVSETPGV